MHVCSFRKALTCAVLRCLLSQEVPLPIINKLSSVKQEISASVGPDDVFAVAVCTVDGQRLRLGSPAKSIPLMGTVKPLLYAIAVKDCGKTATHNVRNTLQLFCDRSIRQSRIFSCFVQWVASEPTSYYPDSFKLKDSAHDDVDGIDVHGEHLLRSGVGDSCDN